MKTEYKGFAIKIESDSDPMNPRTDFDNLGTMVCLHRRYELGDYDGKKTIGNQYSDGLEMWLDLANIDRDQPYYARMDDKELTQACVDKFSRTHIWLPLYLFDHSGITMRTTSFSCPWDSGQVGIIYVSHETIRKEYKWKNLTKARIAKIESYLKGEVETYDDYLTGNVYGFIVMTQTEDEDEDGEELDSCWGFYGDPEKSGCMDEAKAIVDNRIYRRRQSHFVKLKAWIKSKVPVIYREPAPQYCL